MAPNADMNRRMAAVLCTLTNQVCVDCPEKRPLWASFLLSPVESNRRIGMLCCTKCAQHHHFELGEERTFIKYLKMAHEWEMEEIEWLEEAGNAFVNASFEAKLDKDDYDKTKYLKDEEAEDKSRAKFIKRKYKKQKYFDKEIYQQQVLKASQRKRAIRKAWKPEEDD